MRIDLPDSAKIPANFEPLPQIQVDCQILGRPGAGACNLEEAFFRGIAEKVTIRDAAHLALGCRPQANETDITVVRVYGIRGRTWDSGSDWGFLFFLTTLGLFPTSGLERWSWQIELCAPADSARHVEHFEVRDEFWAHILLLPVTPFSVAWRLLRGNAEERALELIPERMVRVINSGRKRGMLE